MHPRPGMPQLMPPPPRAPPGLAEAVAATAGTDFTDFTRTGQPYRAGGAMARLSRQEKRIAEGKSKLGIENLVVYARVAASRAQGVFLTREEYARLMALDGA